MTSGSNQNILVLYQTITAMDFKPLELYSTTQDLFQDNQSSRLLRPYMNMRTQHTLKAVEKKG